MEKKGLYITSTVIDYVLQRLVYGFVSHDKNLQIENEY